MSELPAALKAHVPTLTEVLKEPELPDLGDDPPWTEPAIAPLRDEPPAFLRVPAAVSAAFAGAEQHGFKIESLVEAVVARLDPQMEALVSSRLRDVLGPAIQEAVDDAVERCRQPLIEALQVQLREQLEQALAQHANPGTKPFR